LRRKEVNAVHLGTISAVGVEEEGHQRAQHCRRWQRAVGGDGVGAGMRGGSAGALGGVGEREEEILQV
jgi:hypothetical protein